MMTTSVAWLTLLALPVEIPQETALCWNGLPFDDAMDNEYRSGDDEKPKDMPESIWNALNQEEMANLRALILEHKVVVKFDKLAPNKKGKPTVGRLQKRGKNYTMIFNEEILSKAPKEVLKQHLAHEGLHLRWSINEIQMPGLSEEVEAFTEEAKIWKKVKGTLHDSICDGVESFIFNEEGQIREDWEIEHHLKRLGYRHAPSILDSQEHTDEFQLELGAIGFYRFDFDATPRLTSPVTYLGLPHDATVRAEEYDAWLEGVILGLDLPYFTLKLGWAMGEGDGTGSATLTDGVNTDTGTFKYDVKISTMTLSVERSFSLFPDRGGFTFGPYLGLGVTYQKVTYKNMRIEAAENVALSRSENETDFIATGGLGVKSVWKLGKGFSLSVGAGYSGYVGFGGAAEATVGVIYGF